eukprot:TRINITY_DN19515_c0_g3_i1.p1 TRINITY_DN19515_c0_g3~~TRINITY_DN19515_c0_g3_i1.p1  ORF type:complete len:688 (+),score=206.52 TRINITY_DN19515_c0_g3_i1:272-2335(+)
MHQALRASFNGKHDYELLSAREEDEFLGDATTALDEEAALSEERECNGAYLDEDDLAKVVNKMQQDIDIKKKESQEAQDELENYRRMAEKSELFWANRIEEIEKDLLRCDAKLESKEFKLEAVLSVEIPPGPKCLRFVDGNLFLLISTFMVCANVATMLLEFMDPGYKSEFFWYDQMFCVFYVVELILKALLFQRKFLCGPILVVWWNWLDFIVVIIGVLDQWVKPLLMSEVSGGSGAPSSSSTILQGVKMLRLARLFRVLKIVRFFFHMDLDWAEEDPFQIFIMGVIGFNSLMMSFEADYADLVIWYYLEQILLVIFAFELAVRLRLYGLKFWCGGEGLVWNYMDFTIVIGGIVDSWLMPMVGFFQVLLGGTASKSGKMGQIMNLLRTARLLRILRLVRLVRGIPPLFLLIIGIVEAMRGMFWVLVLTSVVLYVFGLLSVKLLGHGLVFGGPESTPEVIKNTFPDVPQSMFVLFMAMIGEISYVEPLFEIAPSSKVAFMLYIVLSSWAILSILTAVISENMIRVTATSAEEQQKEREEQEWLDSMARLGTILGCLDDDGNGRIDASEFRKVIEDEETATELANLSGGMSKEELIDVFDCVSVVEGTDSLPLDVFAQALRCEGNPAAKGDTLNLEMRMCTLEKALANIQEMLQAHGCSPAPRRTQKSSRFSRVFAHRMREDKTVRFD